MARIDIDTWREIFLTITRNKTRSFLTAFGIFWGIFMLLIIMGGASGLKDLLSRNFEGFATNSGFIVPNLTTKAYKGYQQGRAWTIKSNDLIQIRQKVKGVEIITPMLHNWGASFLYKEHKSKGTLKGITNEYAFIEIPELKYGRYISSMDHADERKVCVIGKKVYEELFPKGGNVCGQQISVNGIYYTIIGVYAKEGNIGNGGSISSSVFIPLSVFQKNYNRGDDQGFLNFTARPGYKVADVEKEVVALLKEAHSIHPDDKQAVVTFNAEVLFSMMDDLFKGINVLGLMVGLGTLFAGAIGVSNIMMITVKERTSEIGIRRAIGARPKDIVQQILSESLVLTIIAGLLGVAFSVLVLYGLEVGTAGEGEPAHFVISFFEAIGAGLLLTLLGLLAGLAPAVRAMSIKPIDAIRDE